MGGKAKTDRPDGQPATTSKMIAAAAAIAAGLAVFTAVAAFAGPSIWREIKIMRM